MEESILLLGLAIAVYFVPAMVAGGRNHRNSTAIFVLTLLLGWTGLGWIIALVWACTSNVKSSAEQRSEADEKPVM